MLYVLYIDDSILAGPNPKDIAQSIKYIKAAKLNITDESDIQDSLGLNTDHRPDGTIHLNQPHLIDQILDDLNMSEKTKPKDTPDSSSKYFRGISTQSSLTDY